MLGAAGLVLGALAAGGAGAAAAAAGGACAPALGTMLDLVIGAKVCYLKRPACNCVLQRKDKQI